MLATLLFLLLASAPAEDRRTPAYLGQEPPGEKPVVFAPGMISKPEEYEFSSVFSEDGLEFFYGVDLGERSEIRGLRYSGGEWGAPEVVVADERFSYNDPFLSLDDERLFFISNQSLDNSAEIGDSNIWFVEREVDRWSVPRPVAGGVNSEADEYYISFTEDGSLYFASNIAASNEPRSDFDIYSAPATAAGFGQAVRLEGGVNSKAYEADAFVSPDGSYLIFSSTRRSGLGRGDLYISFRAEDGTWLPAQSLGEPINTPHHELCPFVSRDGRFLFYTSDRDIYWVSMSLLESVRPEQARTD